MGEGKIGNGCVAVATGGGWGLGHWLIFLILMLLGLLGIRPVAAAPTVTQGFATGADNPIGMALASNKDLYVAAWNPNQILKYSASGAW